MGTATHYLEINAPAQRCYDWWRPLTHLPDIVPDVPEVEPRPPEADRTHWKVSGPAGTTFEWDARIVEDESGRKITWKSVDSEDGGKTTIPNGGAVRFDDHGDSTGVEVSLHFDPPGGHAGQAMASMFADPQQKVEAGQIEFRAHDDDRDLIFEIETWSRPGDRAAALLFDRLLVAKETQLHMWSQFCLSVASFAGGRRDGPVTTHTRRADWPARPSARPSPRTGR